MQSLDVSFPRSVFPFNSGMKIYVSCESYDAYASYTTISTSNSEKVLQANWGVYDSYVEPLYLEEK